MKRQQTTANTCETCSIGTWYDVQWNRSVVDGKPITKHCPHMGYGVIRRHPACKYYTAE